MARDRTSPRQRLAELSGIAGLFLALLLWVATMNPDVVPWVGGHAKVVGYTALVCFGVAALGMLKAAADAIAESTLARRTALLFRSPERWWPPTKQRVARELEKDQCRERDAMSLAGTAAAVAQQFRELMDRLDPMPGEKEETTESPEMLWDRLALMIPVYEAAIARATAEDTSHHEHALSHLRRMVVEKGRPEQYYFEVLTVIEDWLRRFREGKPIPWGLQLLQAKSDAIRSAGSPATLRLSAEVVELPYSGQSEQTIHPITRTERHAAAPRFGIVRVENRSGRDIPSLIARMFLEDEPWKGFGAWASEPVGDLMPARLDEGPTLRAGAERLLVLAVIYPSKLKGGVGQTWYAVREPFRHIHYFDPILVINSGTNLGTKANFRVVFEAEGLRQEVGFRLASDASGPVAKPPLGARRPPAAAPPATKQPASPPPSSRGSS